MTADETDCTALADIHRRIAAAAARAGRDLQSVTLVAVSKTRTVDEIAQLHALGQKSFGENYVQEAVAKMDTLAALPLDRGIGPARPAR